MIKNAIKREAREEGIKEGIKEGIEKGIKEGLEKGVREGKIEIAKNLINMQMDYEDISKATGLSVEELKQIKEQ
ncbi:MAG: hypothetical protein J6G98_00005 [Bacilli bacterium]|nr:hypothetical protein [Bacilli bacterium]